MKYRIYELVKEEEIITPNDGWKEHTYYVVQVSYGSTNPVHTAILGIGFVNKDGHPGSYSEIWCNSYDNSKPFNSAWYIEVVKVIGKIKE